MKTQTQLATKWGVSRSLISKYHKAGMPLEEGKAAAWLWTNVPCSKIHLGIEDARSAPSRSARGRERDPREGDPKWKLTAEETIECVQILLAMKAEGAHRQTHRKHQAWCDGIRLAVERGADLTPEEWREASEEA